MSKLLYGTITAGKLLQASTSNTVVDNAGVTPVMLSNASAQYKYLVAGATPFAYAESGGFLNITTAKTLAIQNNLTLSGVDGKTLTLTGSLTVPADGTAALLGVANIFTAQNTIQPATDVINLIIKHSAAAATANDLEVRDSGNVVYLSTNTGTGLTTVRGKTVITAVGADLVTNGLFSIDASGWTLGAGWAHDGAAFTAKHTAGNTATLSQAITLTNGAYYRVGFSIKTATAGSVNVSVNGTASGAINSNTGGYFFNLLAGASGGLVFTPSSDFDGSIDNVSLVLLTPSTPIVALKDNAGTTTFEIRQTDFTAFGLNAGRFMSNTGQNNFAMGNGAQANLSTGLRNVAIGENALLSASNTAFNVAVGVNALLSMTAGSNNVAIGAGALQSAKNVGNTVAIGQGALSAYIGSNIDGNNGNCVAIGGAALSHLTYGYDDIAIGASALLNATTAVSNIALGGSALIALLTGNSNIGIGSIALYGLTSGGGNVAIGYYAMLRQTTEAGTTAIGNFAGAGLGAAYSVFIGANAGYLNLTTKTGRDFNVVIGASAGVNLTGTSNVFIGYQSGYYETGSNTLFIDNIKRTNEADGRIKTLIYGTFASTPIAQQLTLNGKLNINSQATAAGITTTVTFDVQGSGAANDGGALLLAGKSSTTNSQSMGMFKWLWSTATHATRKARILGTVYDTAERTWLQVDTDGSVSSVQINSLIYGHMYADDIAQVVTVSAGNTEYKVTAGLSGGTCNGTTFQNARELLCTIAGTYEVTWGMSVSSGTNNENLSGGVVINTVTWQHKTEGSSNQNNSNNAVHISGTGTITLAVNDTVGLFVENESAAHDMTVRHANLTLVRIGA